MFASCSRADAVRARFVNARAAIRARLPVSVKEAREAEEVERQNAAFQNGWGCGERNAHTMMQLSPHPAERALASVRAMIASYNDFAVKRDDQKATEILGHLLSRLDHFAEWHGVRLPQEDDDDR